MNAAVTEPLLEPTRAVSPGFQILLALATAGTMVTLMPVLTVLIPAQVTQIEPQRPADALALVLTLGAVGALLGHPLAGALSDRTSARFGRRRPWLLTGLLGSLTGLLILANSYSIALIAAAWFMVQFFGNMMLSGYTAVLADRVPVRQRGATQAIIGLSSPVAMILSNIMFIQISNLRAAYYPLAAVLAVFAMLFLGLYNEEPIQAGSLPPFRLKAFLSSFVIKPRKNPNFATMWLFWLLIWFGYTLGTGSFFFLYLQNITGYERLFPGQPVRDGIALVQMLQIAIGVPVMLGAGVLSDHIGRRKPFVVAGSLMVAVGAGLLVGFSNWPVVLVASVVAGAGFQIYYNLGVAMITQLLPSADSRGKDLGVINVAACLPQIIMPVVGAAILNVSGIANPAGYQILFGLAAAAALLGVGLLRKVKV